MLALPARDYNGAASLHTNATAQTMTDSLQEAKAALRKQVLARREALPDDARRAAELAIEKRVFALTKYERAKCVMAYMSFGMEMDVTAIVEAIIWSGKKLVLPRVNRATKTLSLHRVENMADLVAGVWSIREPRADLPTVTIDAIDLVLMPGVAFDIQGNRLGYGAGFYDKLLVSTSAQPTRVAATFDCQLVDAVPTDAHDQRVHVLITESRTIEITP